MSMLFQPCKDDQVHQLLKNAHIGAWNLNVVQDEFQCDESTCILHHIAVDLHQIPWNRFLKSIHPDDRRLFEQLLQPSHSIETNSPFQFEYRPMMNAQNVEWLQCRGGITYDSHQQPLSIYGIIQDITYIKTIEHELQEANQLIQGFQQLTNFGSWRTNFITNTIHWSDSVYEMFGVSPEGFELTRNNFLQLVHQDDRDNVRQAFVDAVMNRCKYSIDHRVVLPDNSIRWMRENADIIYDENRHPVEMVGTVQDITALIKKDEQIRISEAVYSSLVENLPQCVFRKDINGVFTFVDSDFCNLLGKTFTEIVGKTDYDLYPYSLADKYHHDDLEVIHTGKMLHLKEQNVLPDGSTMTVEVIKTPVKDDRGNVIAIQGIFWDVTETIRLEEQLRQSQKMDAIGQLAGGIAHDFNNILVAINVNCDIAMTRVERNTELYEELNEIKQASNRAAALTRQMLAFSRKQVLNISIVDPNELIINLKKMLNRIIGEHIILETRMAQDLPCIQADPGQIEQAILNLVVNARDAMPNGGEIVIETSHVIIESPLVFESLVIEPGEYVTIEVRDKGYGIQKELIPHIFEPFFTTKEQGKGTGLGLSTVYGIVKQSNGYINVTSVPDFGTEFTIYLPAANNNEHNLEENAITDTSTLMPLTVLLVEDEKAVRSSLTRVLQQNHFQVLTAENGEQALELFKNHAGQIDLLISDIIMPGMNGIQLVEQIQNIQPFIKTLLISGYADNHLSSKESSKISFQFLPKPFTPEVLLDKIHFLTNEKKQ